MKFVLEFDCGNAAFDDDAAPEAARILRNTAEYVMQEHTSGNLLDINGNTVGKWEFVG